MKVLVVAIRLVLGSHIAVSARLVPLFPYEEAQLSPKTLQQFPKEIAPLFSPHDGEYATASPFADRECKVFPGDQDWPSTYQWNHLRNATGSLIAARPASHVCYNNGTSSLNQTACDVLTGGWLDPFNHLEDPIEMFSAFFEGTTCLPPTVYNSSICTQGGYPVYTVNVTNVAQIQLAVNFARNTGIRLAIKNTGHDYLGKSGGAGSLSVWLHHLKSTTYLPNYRHGNYSGPAMKAGAGVQVYDLYAAANAVGMLAVGGECATVGVVGGYSQGGGHSPMGSVFGMGADQVLSLEVVTADGKFISANAEENADLFWALRGGGGGTYGIVTSVVLKLYPDMSITTTAFEYSSTANNGVSVDQIWTGLRAYLNYFERWADSGIYSYFTISNYVPGELSFSVRPFFVPNSTVAETAILLDPFFDDLKAAGIEVEQEYKHFDNFYEAWDTSFTKETILQAAGFAFGSRLWPRTNWANSTILNATFDAIKATLENDYSVWGFSLAPTEARGGYSGAAVHPAWRHTLAHAHMGVVFANNATTAEILDIRGELQDVYMQKWRDLSPGAGSYLNEGDRSEPDFQDAFYGSNYPALLEVKKRHDPWDVFWAATAVGSEGWSVRSIDGLPNENGRLCRTGGGDA